MRPKNRYRLIDKLKLAYWLLRSKLISKKIRLIRFPFDIRGGKYIDLGTGLTTGSNCRFEAFSPNGTCVLHFGNNVQVNDRVHISAMKHILIGDNVLIASNVYISDNSHGYYKGTHQHTSPNIPPIERPYYCSDVVIEDNVWVGEGVIIMPGITIGKGSVIGAHSVVSKNIPAETIAVGAPASGIKIFDHTTNKWVKI